MTNKIRSISAFKGIKTPSIEVQGGYIPDLHSRYFTADFSYGLAIIQQIAQFADLYTPFIHSTLEWYKKIAVVKAEFRYRDYGIVDKKTFKRFYCQ